MPPDANTNEGSIRSAITGGISHLKKFGEIFEYEATIDPEKQFLLPAPLVDVLRPACLRLGFPITDELAKIDDHLQNTHYFYMIKIKTGYIALLFIQKEFVQNAANSYNMFWMGPAWKNSPLGMVQAMFFFSNADKVDDSFESVKSFFEAGLKFKKVEFFDYDFAYKMTNLSKSSVEKVANLLAERLGFNSLFQNEALQTPAAAEEILTYKELKDDKDTQDELVTIIAEQVANAAEPKDYLINHIKATHWPEKWQETRIAAIKGEDYEGETRALVKYALSQGTIPNMGKLTALGDLLQKLTDEVGGEALDKLRAAMKKYNLTPE
jgi:hypothetical protein